MSGGPLIALAGAVMREVGAGALAAGACGRATVSPSPTANLADGTPYLPEGPLDRARVLQWMFFEQYEIEPNLAVARFWIALLGEEEKYAGELEGKWRAGNKALAALDEHLDGRKWIVADAFSIADISLYGYTHVAGEGGFDLAQYPNAQAWLERVAARPGHVPIEA